MTGYTVLFYDRRSSRVVREHTYATRNAAFAAMARARRRGQIALLAGLRTADDPPTVHH